MIVVVDGIPMIAAGFVPVAAVAACWLQHDFSQEHAQSSPQHAEVADVVVETTVALTSDAGQAVAAVVSACWQQECSPAHALSQQPVHVAVAAADSAAVIRSIAKTHVANAAKTKTAGVDFMSNPLRRVAEKPANPDNIPALSQCQLRSIEARIRINARTREKADVWASLSQEIRRRQIGPGGTADNGPAF